MPSALERRTLRRVMRRIVPLVMILYFVAFLDRVNVGFAALTMNRDIGLDSAQFGFGAGVFFVGYFLFEVPSNLALHRFGARLWIARVMLTWGLVSGAMAFVAGPRSFYVLRFLLGVAEAGFFPGIILYLTYWFPARSRAAVTAMFMAAAPLSSAIGSPISGALMQLHGWLGLAGWQWLFLAEAVPALALAPVVLRLMTDRPEQATWLGEEERAWLTGALAQEAAARAGAGAPAPLSPQGSPARGPWRAMADPRVLALSLVYFGTSAGLYTLGLWAPQIIGRFGLDPLQIGLLNAIPNVVAVVGMFLWARHSDRTDERTWHVVLACLCAAAGLALAATAGSVLGVVMALSVVNLGISAAKPPLWSMPTLFLSGGAAAAGIATINSIGNLGGFVGPWVIGWLHGRSGSFSGGLYAVAAALVVSACVTLALSRDPVAVKSAGP